MSQSEIRVLAISAHSDDETLGCGGTLHKHRRAGDSLYCIVATSPCEPIWPAQTVERKAAQLERVAKAYGLTELFTLEFPDSRLDTIPFAQLINRIDKVVSEVRPNTVYVVHGGDVHTDHTIVHRATMSALKPFRMSTLGVRRVLSYETMSSTDAASQTVATAFLPTVYSDISQFIDQKLDTMALYHTEVHADPWPRGPSAIRSLARYRGASIGVEYAEAFCLLRELI